VTGGLAAPPFVGEQLVGAVISRSSASGGISELLELVRHLAWGADEPDVDPVGELAILLGPGIRAPPSGWGN